MPTPMPTPHSRVSRDADQAAIAWFVRMNDPASGAAERAEFHDWLAADPAHARAYAAVERLWRRLDGPAQELGAGGWYRVNARASRARRLRPVFAAAASVALLIGALWWRDPGFPVRMMADYAAAPGESRSTTLADGSKVYLDSDSALSVSITGGERLVTVTRGRVWFDVKHEADRDFVVAADGVQVRVLGTAFALEREDNRVRVTVERGLVAVSSDKGSKPVELTPHKSVTVELDTGRVRIAELDAEAALTWHRGLMVFDRASLGEVAAEIERRMAGRVLLAGGDLRRVTLSGVFRADDPGALLEALQSTLGLKVSRLPGFAVLIHR